MVASSALNASRRRPATANIPATFPSTRSGMNKRERSDRIGRPFSGVTRLGFDPSDGDRGDAIDGDRGEGGNDFDDEPDGVLPVTRTSTSVSGSGCPDSAR